MSQDFTIGLAVGLCSGMALAVLVSLIGFAFIRAVEPTDSEQWP